MNESAKIDDFGASELVSSGSAGVQENCLITVAIPAYKHEIYIKECLNSLLVAKYLDQIEVIIVDDCSPDKTVSVALDLLQKSSVQYRLYRNKTNQGLSYGLNFLLSETRGRFFLCCASDDIIVANALDRLIEEIGQSGGPVSFEICGARFFGDRFGLVYNTPKMLKLTQSTDMFYRWVSTEIPKPLLLQSTVFNSTFLKDINPWKDRLLLDDWPTFIRAGRKARNEGLAIKFNKDVVLTKYRVHSGGLHTNIDRQKKACLDVITVAIDPEFMFSAESSALSDFAFMEFVRQKYFAALQCYIKAVVRKPGVDSLTKAPKMISLGILRVVGRKMRLIK